MPNVSFRRRSYPPPSAYLTEEYFIQVYGFTPADFEGSGDITVQVPPNTSPGVIPKTNMIFGLGRTEYPDALQIIDAEGDPAEVVGFRIETLDGEPYIDNRPGWFRVEQDLADTTYSGAQSTCPAAFQVDTDVAPEGEYRGVVEVSDFKNAPITKGFHFEVF